MILPEVFWLHSYIKVDGKPVHFSFFLKKDLKFIGQLFNDNGNIKPWKDLKIEFHLKDTHKIYWLQIIDALPKKMERYHFERQRECKKFSYF